MTQAKIQPFCRKDNLTLGVYIVKQKTIRPRSATQRNICLYFHENIFVLFVKSVNQPTLKP